MLIDSLIEGIMTNKELQEIKKQYGKTLKRKRKELKRAKNYFVTNGLAITLMTSIEENKTNYTFESVLKYAHALGFKLNFIEDGNPIVTEEEFHTCDGLLKSKEKGK